jgi:hypothetical protein
MQRQEKEALKEVLFRLYAACRGIGEYGNRGIS